MEDYQGDYAQQPSKLLSTTTEITSLGSSFSSVTYYIRKIRSSFISVFISLKSGIKNNTNYPQGNLILTKDATNETTAFLKNGNLFIHPRQNESYSIDSRGNLICVTTETP